MGQKQKTEKKRKKERAKVGDNNSQATHGARKPPGPKIQFISYEKSQLENSFQKVEIVKL